MFGNGLDKFGLRRVVFHSQFIVIFVTFQCGKVKNGEVNDSLMVKRKKSNEKGCEKRERSTLESLLLNRFFLLDDTPRKGALA